MHPALLYLINPTEHKVQTSTEVQASQFSKYKSTAPPISFLALQSVQVYLGVVVNLANSVLKHSSTHDHFPDTSLAKF